MTMSSLRSLPLPAARAASCLFLVAVLGCASAGGNRQPGSGGSGGSGGDGGSGGGGGDNGGGGYGGTGGGAGSTGTDDCPDSAKLVYLLDNDNSLWSFKPNQTDITKSVLTKIGPLSCSATLFPNSMAVDRTGHAWIEYVPDDETNTTVDALYKVDVTNASCSPTSFSTSSFGTHFGMGFVTDVAKGTTETLFVAKDVAPWGLGKLDLSSFNITHLGTPNGGPELTGTGAAELWGFFPDVSSPRVSQLDKSSGAEGKSYAVSQAAGDEDGYAFAFWGGDFWVFLKKMTDSSTVLYHVRGSDGHVDTWTMSGHWIIGAGVSTCAPTIPIT